MPILHSSFLSSRHWVYAALLAVVAALYLPWLDNPLIFDDQGFFTTGNVYNYAPYPLSLQARQFPYFTLGFEYMLSGGNVAVSRMVAIIIHAANAGLLYTLLMRLRETWNADARSEATDSLALSVALIFAVHPVATYGVAYLVQRTSLLACLFMLASANTLLSALERPSFGRAIAAGLLYGMSVMSKEHAVTGAAAIFFSGWLKYPRGASERRPLELLSVYVATCTPFAVWVSLSKSGFWGVAYEPDVVLLSAIPLQPSGNGVFHSDNLHLISALYQCWFYFRYLFLWWVPLTHWMSIDLRPRMDFDADLPWLVVCAATYGACMFACTRALLCRSIPVNARLVLIGLGWVCALFLVELVSVRFQEPLVLYRSYLWAPGYLMMLAATVQMLPIQVRKVIWLVPLVLVWPMQERMRTFSTDLLLWEDAVLKLDDVRRPDAARAFYNRGMAHLALRQAVPAMADFTQIIRNRPESLEGYWARSAAYNAIGRTDEAISDVEAVLRINPDFGAAYFRLGFLAHRMGNLELSEQSFAKASKYGYPEVHLNGKK